MLELLTDPQVWIAFLTLTALEIVLGIDNIIFIAILVGRLPEQQREKARMLGLGFAMLTRIALLFSLVWLMAFSKPLFTVLGEAFSLRDVVLILGGLFLLFKSTLEIHNSLEGGEGHSSVGSASFSMVIVQIGVIDLVFSIDSVITAVGLVEHVEIMVAAIIIAVLVMLVAARAISEFVDDHPTIKMLALSFLFLVGMALIAEGFDLHIPKGYIYFAMAFSVVVEILNIKIRKKRAPVKLHKPISDNGETK